MSENPPGQKVVILLVDDEELVRGIVRTALTGAGFDVLDAENGRAALEMSRAHSGPIHLLLSDVHMPNMDGITLAKIVATERPGTRVLLMTGYATMNIPPSLIPLVISKPFRMDEVVARVESELAGR
jgi:DNA-binding NtrC family response regulator